MVKVSVQLPAIDVIERKVIQALRQSLNTLLVRAAQRITIELRVMIYKAIVDSPEYQSMNGGQLQGELGLPTIDLVDDIIAMWVRTVTVKVRRVRFTTGQIDAGFEIRAIQRDWSDVLAHPSASIPIKNGQLPWLDWMLTHGDKVIVRDYGVTVNAHSKAKSRSGKATMVKGRGKRWRVPPQFSGTTTNNFVTRALDSIEIQVNDMIEDVVLSEVK